MDIMQYIYSTLYSVVINMMVSTFVCFINTCIAALMAIWAVNNKRNIFSKLIIYASVYYETITNLTVILPIKLILMLTRYKLSCKIYMLVLMNIYSMCDTILILQLIRDNRKYFNVIKSFRSGICDEYIFTLRLYFQQLKYRSIINIANITTDDTIYFFGTDTYVFKFISADGSVNYLGLIINITIFVYIFHRLQML